MPRPLIGAPIVSKKRVQDLVLAEFDPRYCRGAISLTAGTYLIGQVIANATQAPEANGAEPSQSDVLCLENIVVPSGKTYSVAAFVRGPALLNLDEVERTEDETDAELITRLADLLSQGVRFVREPSHQIASGRDD